MKISKQVWIDEKVKWDALKKIALLKRNEYKGQAYIICTSIHSNLLFEIIDARQLSSIYETCTVLAVCKNKGRAIEQVAILIDELYNKKTRTYEELLE